MKIKKNGFGLSFLLALGISFTAIFFTVLFPSLFKKSTSLGKEKLSSINKKVYSIPIINPIDSLLSDFNYEIIIQDSSENSFNGFSDNYQEDSSQILCFRGDEGRRNPTRGIIKSKPSKIIVDWKIETKTSNPLSLTFIEKCLHEIIPNISQVQHILHYIKEKREKHFTRQTV